jgi:hypothetical protein
MVLREPRGKCSERHWEPARPKLSRGALLCTKGAPTSMRHAGGLQRVSQVDFVLNQCAIRSTAGSFLQITYSISDSIVRNDCAFRTASVQMHMLRVLLVHSRVHSRIIDWTGTTNRNSDLAGIGRGPGESGLIGSRRCFDAMPSNARRLTT